MGNHQVYFFLTFLLAACGSSQTTLNRSTDLGPGNSNGSSGVGSGSGNTNSGLHRIVTREIRRTTSELGPFILNCPAGYTLVGGGTELKQWSGGSNQPDSSFPDPDHESWVVHIGGPESSHRNNVWNAYAICVKSERVERVVVDLVIARDGNNLSDRASCPTGMAAVSAGTQLIHWSGGNNQVDSSYPSEANSADWEFTIGGPQSSQANNQWIGYLVCARSPSGLALPRAVVSRVVNRSGTQGLGPYPAVCPNQHMISGGGWRLTNWVAGRNTMDSMFPQEQSFRFIIGGAQSSQVNNTWSGYAVCLRY